MNDDFITDDFKRDLASYRQTINYLEADCPIQVLCLPTKIESILISGGYLRVYDLFNVDFIKIKGIGVTRSRYITAALDQFLSMSI